MFGVGCSVFDVRLFTIEKTNIEHPTPNSQHRMEEPLTLSLSPAYRGEGTGGSPPAIQLCTQPVPSYPAREACQRPATPYHSAGHKERLAMFIHFVLFWQKPSTPESARTQL